MKKLIEKVKEILSWIISKEGSDGEAHIIVCVLLTSIISMLTNVGLGVFTAIIAGVGKEVNDITKGDTWKNSVHDLICDAIGIAFGLIIYVFHIFKMI